MKVRGVLFGFVFFFFYRGFWESAPASRAFELHGAFVCTWILCSRAGRTLVHLSTPTPLSNTEASTGRNLRAKLMSFRFDLH